MVDNGCFAGWNAVTGLPVLRVWDDRFNAHTAA